jgi:RNA polymerase sigma-70 factor (ECF subfamily)
MLHRQREVIRSFSQEAASPELSQDYGLEAAIAELPESYRRVVLLRYYGDSSCSEVAEQLDMPLGTVTKTLSRAYAMLRKSLQQPNEAESYEVQK